MYQVLFFLDVWLEAEIERKIRQCVRTYCRRNIRSNIDGIYTEYTRNVGGIYTWTGHADIYTGEKQTESITYGKKKTVFGYS